MKILVTGGSGFLGSHIADALSDAGHDVRIFDVSRSAFLRPTQEMVIGSILDRGAIAEAIKGCDVVYHLAAVADLDEAINDPLRTVEVNILGTTLLLEAAREARIGRFAYASTIYVYSNHGSFYRTSKRACELLIEDYWERYQIPYTILRFGSLYGPRADHHNSVYCLLKQGLTERKIKYAGSGKEMREYVHVLDAAQAAVEILAPQYKNENISLTGRERMTTSDMIEMVREMLGGDIDVEFQPHPKPGHYVHTPYSYTPKLGRKLVRNTYIDLGLGLLDCMQEIDRKLRADVLEK